MLYYPALHVKPWWQSPACPAEKRPAPCTAEPPFPDALVCFSPSRKHLHYPNTGDIMNVKVWSECILCYRLTGRPAWRSSCSSNASLSCLSFCISSSNWFRSSLSVRNLSSSPYTFAQSTFLWSASLGLSLWTSCLLCADRVLGDKSYLITACWLLNNTIQGLKASVTFLAENYSFVLLGLFLLPGLRSSLVSETEQN